MKTTVSLLFISLSVASGFVPRSSLPIPTRLLATVQDSSPSSATSGPPNNNNDDDDKQEEILGPLAAAAESPVDETPQQAATRTVNERLLQELEEQSLQTKRGSASDNPAISITNVWGGATKTDEEREAAIAAARNLNGVNPVVTTLCGLLALAAAYGLWNLTLFAGDWFVSHPLANENNLYVVDRVAAVVRNVSMGLLSLASGFFGVTGLGILLLGLQVAVGVAQGTLDPTPLPQDEKQKEEILSQLPNMWQLMTGDNNKKRRR